MYQSAVEGNSLSGVIESKKLITLDQISSVRAHVEVAFKSDNGDLILIGWIYDPENLVLGLSVLFQKQEKLLKKTTYTQWPLEQDIDNVQLNRVKRPDVAHAFAKIAQEGNDQHGLVLMVPNFPADGRLTLAFRDGRFATLPFVALNDAEQIKQRLKNCWAHSGVTLVATLKKALGEDDSLTQMVDALSNEDHAKPPGPEREDSVKFNVEGALYVTDGLVLIGWTTANEDGNVRINVSDGQGWQHDALFLDGADGLRLIRTFRPDLVGALSSAAFGKGLHGFVLYWPLCNRPPETVSIWFDGSQRKQQDISVFRLGQETYLALLPLWIHFGNALKAIAAQLQDEQMFSSLLEEIEAERAAQASPLFATCDHALLLNNRALILNGWIAKPGTELVRVELVVDRILCDITSQVIRYPRPDLVPVYPWSGEEALGFLTVVDDPSVLSCNFNLKIISNDGETQLIRPKVQVLDWHEMRKFLNHHGAIVEPLLKEFEDAAGWEKGPKQLLERIAWLRQGSFMARHAHLPTIVEDPETVIAAIDRAYPLGKAGLLIFGWRFSPNRKQLSVTVRSAEGKTIDVTGRMFDLARPDVVQSYRPRFPDLNDWCGFVCLAPLPTRPGEARALCIDCGHLNEVWLKVPTEKPKASGVELIKEILGMVPAPERMRHNLYDLFSCGLGQAIEEVSRSRALCAGRIEERQFGNAPDAAEISVVVPLYGRFDFLRHQLAHFVDDKDFASIDLIYVIDDPAIIPQVLELASKYYPLFEVPFRVAWYGQNLGFAGSNNIGASIARGDYLVLVNSDVIPKHVGWLTTLRRAIEELPDAGAVGPLLQFSDSSIQHAGMYPHHDELLPGFILNKHKHMGIAWSGNDEPSEHPMLTAACLMLRKTDYLASGGLDEGYIIGDFEDSDLCLALRKQGKRLWLVPKAKLWHLERQSQNLESIAGQRQMLTLFNGWRYNEKIRKGTIADPMQGDLQLCKL